MFLSFWLFHDSHELDLGKNNPLIFFHRFLSSEVVFIFSLNYPEVSNHKVRVIFLSGLICNSECKDRSSIFLLFCFLFSGCWRLNLGPST